MEAQLVDTMFAIRPRKSRSNPTALHGEVERFQSLLRRFGLRYRIDLDHFVFEANPC